jgi:tRNA 2-selenouridine synthase
MDRSPPAPETTGLASAGSASLIPAQAATAAEAGSGPDRAAKGATSQGAGRERTATEDAAPEALPALPRAGTALPVEAFLRGGGAIVDVRSPGEFAQGHIPGAVNLPLFDDGERAEIGTLYRQAGRQAAVRRGLALVGPRLEALAEQLQRASEQLPSQPLRLHCWRGGMRSGSMAQLAEQLELPALLLAGGSKAYRRWVLQRFERPWPLRLLGGRTGTGKTALLLALRQRGVAVVDLEGRANHRGSSFGALGLPPQPSVEHYENLLAMDLGRLQGAREIWLEAESSQVGRCRIPAALWQQMKQAPALEVRRSLAWRVGQLMAVYGPQDPAAVAEATRRIARRLGPQRTSLALEAIAAGDARTACLQMLDYYDRCYDHDLSSHAVESVDLGDDSAARAAERLLEQGLVRRHDPAGAGAAALD